MDPSVVHIPVHVFLLIALPCACMSQVCAAVGVEELSKGRSQLLGYEGARNLRVGRLDVVVPPPPSSPSCDNDNSGGSGAAAAQQPQGLGPATSVFNDTADVAAFVSQWSDLGFTADEAVALAGMKTISTSQVCRWIGQDRTGQDRIG